MQRENTPTDVEVKFLAQLVGTHGTEVAPGSDIIEEYFHVFHEFSLSDVIKRAMLATVERSLAIHDKRQATIAFRSPA